MYSTPKKTQYGGPGQGKQLPSKLPSSTPPKVQSISLKPRRRRRSAEANNLQAQQLFGPKIYTPFWIFFGMWWWCLKTNQPFEAPRKVSWTEGGNLVVSRFRIRLGGTWKNSDDWLGIFSPIFSIGNTSAENGGFSILSCLFSEGDIYDVRIGPRQRLHDFVVNLPASSRIHVRDFFSTA